MVKTEAKKLLSSEEAGDPYTDGAEKRKGKKKSQKRKDRTDDAGGSPGKSCKLDREDIPYVEDSVTSMQTETEHVKKKHKHRLDQSTHQKSKKRKQDELVDIKNGNKIKDTDKLTQSSQEKTKKRKKDKVGDVKNLSIEQCTDLPQKEELRTNKEPQKKTKKRKHDQVGDGKNGSKGTEADLPQKEELKTSVKSCEETGDGGEKQEELSPEEARKMERKLKKLRKKEAKKSAVTQSAGAEEEKRDTVVHLGSVYLQTWKSDRPSWVFRKVRQVWLLRNMYHTDKVSDQDFLILLEYLEGLQGKSRVTTIAEAEKLLQSQETPEGTEEATGEVLSAAQLDRVRQVLQVLA